MDGNTQHEEGVLMKVFVGLTAIIAVLAVVIVAINFWSNSSNDEKAEDEELMVVSGFEWEVDKKLLEDSDYTTDDVIDTYEKELKKGDINHRLEVAISYATFVDKKLGFTEKAIAIIEPLGPEITDDVKLADYHEALKKFYEKLGDEEKISFHDEELNKIIDRLGYNNVENITYEND